MRGQVRQPCGQAVDRVVASRHRAVSAHVADIEAEDRVALLAGLDAVAQRIAPADEQVATLVESERRVEQIAMIRDQRLDAKRVGVAVLLVGLQHEHQVAVGHEARLLVENQIRHPRRHQVLVVGGAAAVVVAVALEEGERLDGPVFHLVSLSGCLCPVRSCVSLQSWC